MRQIKRVAVKFEARAVEHVNNAERGMARADGKVTREFVAGTGKYEGMETSGTVEPLGPFPVIKAGTIQDCNHQTGTYKLK